tara:strand:+ start:7528 stop:8172 length:645 start_codon:yes stop_codon:yes gene_type:complete
MKDKIINMELWNSVEKTNPKYTKKLGFGRKFTTVNAYYQIQTATEQFGPYGDGWGVSNENFNMVCDGLLGYQATFWYKLGEDKHSYPINSCIATHNSKGKLDDEIYKKVSTDALTKGLSKIGFNADVFIGKYDDNRYVAELEKEYGEVNINRPHPRNAFKKKMTKQILVSMIDYIHQGQAATVKAKLVDYEVSADQYDVLDKAIKEKESQDASN